MTVPLVPAVPPDAVHGVVVEHGELPAQDLLRRVVGGLRDQPADSVVLAHACPRCGADDHGRPVVLATARLRLPPHVSLSRAGALSLVAVTDVGPVGVDVEPLGSAAFQGVDVVALHPGERAARQDVARAWVRKEALLKACGLGLAVDPRHVGLDDDGALVAWDSPLPRPRDVLVRDLDVPGHIAAVAVLPPPAR